MIEKLKKLIDYHLSQRPHAKGKYERGYVNGQIKGLQDVLSMLGEHYDPIYEIVYEKPLTVIHKLDNKTEEN